MRVVIATDGSDHADRAVAMTAAQSWPEGSRFRVIAVDDGRLVPRVLADAPLAIDGDPSAIEELAADELAEIASAAARSFERPGWSAESEVVRGRAATVIVEEAERFDADLVVVGSRGRGLLGSFTLGSVSAEVVDHAKRPVLIARSDGRIGRVVLADDGSAPAAHARGLVARWPIFAAAEIAVTSVAHVTAPLHSAIAPTMVQAALDDYQRTLDEARAHRDRICREAAAALEATGRSVEVVTREGDPAVQIVALAKEREADLIVVGSRGQTGLTRLLLGSVARNVLYEAPCSVLICR